MPDYQRAYSLLNIKSVQTELRTITGMATTPEPDRVDDIVEPLGASFTNPIPLLLYHKSDKPVGRVTLGTPTAKGIPFSAKIPVIDEAGPLRDRIEEAWQSLKAGLIGAVSIGFRSLEHAMLKSGGVHFLKTEIMELSLVTVPAQPGATISSVKSLFLASDAALRVPTPLSPPAGVPASRKTNMAKTVSDQIAELQTSRVQTAQRMEALMDPVVKSEGSMETAQQTEYDGLMTTLADVDLKIKRLEALERASVAPSATPVRDGQRPHQVTVTEPTLPPGIPLTRAAICQMAAKMFGGSPWEIAKVRYPSHPSIQAFLKAAVEGATTTSDGGGHSPTSGWGAELTSVTQTLTSEFLEYLRPRTIIGRVPNLARVPFNIRVQSQTTGGSASWVGEGKLKPVTKYDYEAVSLGFAKVAAISVLSDELIRFSSPSAEGRVRDALTGSVVERLDIDFINPDKTESVGVSPASITNGITALDPTGTNLAAVHVDVRNLIKAFTDDNVDPAGLVWIMPTTIALNLSLMLTSLQQIAFPNISVNGGTFMGFPVVASQYAATPSASPDHNIVILLNPREIFVADDGGVTVDASNQASIEMSTNPEGDSGTVVSMYQSNQVALRAERYINWKRGRASAVNFLHSVNWSA